MAVLLFYVLVRGPRQESLRKDRKVRDLDQLDVDPRPSANDAQSHR